MRGPRIPLFPNELPTGGGAHQPTLPSQRKPTGSEHVPAYRGTHTVSFTHVPTYRRSCSVEPRVTILSVRKRCQICARFCHTSTTRGAVVLIGNSVTAATSFTRAIGGLRPRFGIIYCSRPCTNGSGTRGHRRGLLAGRIRKRVLLRLVSRFTTRRILSFS